MHTSSPTIPADVAAHVLWHYGHEGGYQPGGFTEQLLTTIGMADPANLDRLAAGFPDYVAAVAAIQYDPNGVEHLQRLVVAIRCIRCGDTDGPFVGAPKQPLCEPCYEKGTQQ
ncbi:hypothetical protein AB0N14_13775 [Streptomyces sp. NPDC051104]|uniref:hypothetical protein n=1 Tax=Streptomyces sp. NPDC051104 TaxID=3155044 RepID=UPI00342D24A5